MNLDNRIFFDKEISVDPIANKKIVAQGKPSELLQNEDAKSLYFGDSFKIN